MRINTSWHKNNPKKRNLSEKDLIQWYVNHERECGCKPIPNAIRTKLAQRKPKLIVSVLAQNNDKHLLVRETLEGGDDCWIIPGGKVEFGESLEEAAKREIEEETGIKAKKLTFLKFFEAIFADYNYHTVIFFYLTKTNRVKLSEDVEGKVKEARWVTLKEAKELKLVKSAQWLFDWMEKNFSAMLTLKGNK